MWRSIRRSLIPVIRWSDDLESLTIGDSDIKEGLFDNDYGNEEGSPDRENINRTIKKLDTDYAKIYDDRFLELARRLPNMKSLSLSSSQFMTSDSFGNTAPIFVANTHFGEFTWKRTHININTSLFINMHHEENESYYLIKNGDLKKLTEGQFMKLAIVRDPTVPDIYFKSIKTFALEFDGFYIEYTLN